jgi:glycosyltransferase involved in cell wall biosynthesis
MNKPRVLFSMPSKHHVEIALDEMTGLQELGYECGSFTYAAKAGYTSGLARLLVIFQNAFNLVATAYRFKPDIIYFNSRLEQLAGIRDFLTIVICRVFYMKKPIFIIKSHGSDIDAVENGGFVFRKLVLPFLKKNVAAWLYLSSEEKEKLSVANYFEDDRIFITKNIVRTGQFKKDLQFKKKLGIPQDHKVLLFVGRVIGQKGVLEVIAAFSIIKLKYKATLIIVGDGDAMTEVNSKITAGDLTHDIILTGFIPEQDVVEYYSNSDILVFPTYFPEGFPMALFNAVGAGMAVVTTKTRAADDYLTEPENCLWVKPRDSADVSRALDRLLQSEGLRTGMGKNNTEKAGMFSKHQVATELSAIFDQVNHRQGL